MTEFSRSDAGHMAAALRLAWRGRYGTHPNPRVGCVLVREDAVVGRGWHAKVGQAHAEINALADAGDAAAGATAYVTLEPCSHHGRTAPCAEALIAAGVARVVVAMRDPFPEVAGRGIAALEAAGITVSVSLLEGEARRLNEGYLSRLERGRPFVRLKIAASLDGATAMRGGESQWITGAPARKDVQRLRAASGAILTGVQTVIDDDPLLTVRDIEPGRQPLRVVVDSTLRTPPASRLLAEAGEVLIFSLVERNRSALLDAGATLVPLPAEEGRPALSAVMNYLAERGVNDVLVECGPTLAGSLVAARLVDELVIYQAPHMMGSETRPMLTTPNWGALANRLELDITDVRRVGADTRITARPRDA